MNRPAMDQLRDFWKPLIGRMAWGVGRGHGSAFHIEFGEPHLVVREPIAPAQAATAKTRRLLQRRSVHVQGDWTFWVNYADWVLRTREGVVTSADDPSSPLNQCLRDLEGQKLMSIAAGARPHSCVVTFDLGAILELWPAADMQDDQWSLHVWNGPVASFRHDGRLAVENARPSGEPGA